MATAEIGALRVVLGMDLAEFYEGTKKAGTYLDNLAAKFGLTQKNLERVALGISAAFLAATAAIAIGMKSAVDRADELSKLAQKIGVPIEQLSSLAYAADLADVGIQDLGTGLKKLDVNLSAIAAGDKTGNAARSLAALGISATTTTGQMRPAADVLRDVAEKFAGLKDDAGKTAIAVALFGKQGANLIPLLNSGAAGLDEMRDRAQRMGLVLDAETGKAAEEFNDRLKDLQYGTRGLFVQVSSELLPVINQLTQAFADWVRGGDGVAPAAKRIADAFKGISEAVIIGQQIITEWGLKLAGTVQATYETLTLDWKAAARTIDATNLAVKLSTEDTIKALAKLNTIAAADPKKPTQDKKDTPILQSTQAIAEAQKELNKAIADGVALVKQSEAPWTKYAREQNDLTLALKNHKISADAAMIAEQKLFEQAKIAYEGGADLIAKYQDPYKNYQDQLEKIDRLQQQNGISAQAAGRMQADAAIMAANAYSGIASNIAGSLSQVFKKNKAVAIAAAIINTAESVTKTLATYGATPWGIAAAAAAAAAGAAQIASIKNTNENGGGSSSGGGSSAPAAVPGLTQTPQTLRVEGINPNQLYSGSAVKGIVDSINDFVKNGGVLISSGVAA